MICGKSPQVHLFANEPPPLNKFSLDRWAVYRIDNNDLIKEEINKPYIDESSI